MKFHPKVSIIIPVYNGSNYLEVAVRSALNQTYDNFEILIVNDGSNDGGKTASIAKKCVAEGNGLIRYFEKTNGGVSSALNVGLREMNGEFFSWLSHDDAYLPSKLEAQVEALAKLNESKQFGTVVYSNFQIIGSRGERIRDVDFSREHTAANLNRSSYALVFGLIHGCTLLIPAKLLRDAEGFDESLRYTQDYDMWLKVMPKADLLFLSQSLILSRAHAEQDSMKVSAKKRREEEEDSLWVRKLELASNENRATFEGADAVFFERLFRILPIDRAHSARSALIRAWRNRTRGFSNRSGAKVSICILPTKSADNQDSRLGTFEQGYSHTEVVKLRNSESVNAILARTSGDYLAFFSLEDFVDSEKVDLQLSHMQAREAPLSFTDLLLVDAKQSPTVTRLSESEIKLNPFTLSRATLSTVLLERRLLEGSKLGSKGIEIAVSKLIQTSDITVLNLPLTEVGCHYAKAKAVHLSNMGCRDIWVWWSRVLGANLRATFSVIRNFLKSQLFQRLPFKLQLAIRRLVSRT